jgi:hypothetical protein
LTGSGLINLHTKGESTAEASRGTTYGIHELGATQTKKLRRPLWRALAERRLVQAGSENPLLDTHQQQPASSLHAEGVEHSIPHHLRKASLKGKTQHYRGHPSWSVMLGLLLTTPVLRIGYVNPRRVRVSLLAQRQANNLQADRPLPSQSSGAIHQAHRHNLAPVVHRRLKHVIVQLAPIARR